MKRLSFMKIVAAVCATISVPAVAGSVSWHFNGEDGTAAPTSLKDASGTYSMTRFLVTQTGQTYANQFTQSDCAGDVACWDENGTLQTDEDVSGSIRLWRENAGDGYRRSCGYWLKYDTGATEAIFPTNSVGEILPFTVELVFKIAPFDETTEKKNLHLFTLGRGVNYGSTGRAVLDVSVNSTGAMYIMCQSRTGSNGDLCKWLVLDESRFRDGEWHHLAVAYDLDTSVSPHQGTLEVFLDYRSLGTQKVSSTDTGVTVLEYSAWNGDAEEKTMWNGHFAVGDGSTACSSAYSVDELRISSGTLGAGEFMRMLPERSDGFFFPMGDAGNPTANPVSGTYAKATAVTETMLSTANMLEGGDVGRLCSVAASFSEGSSFAVDKFGVLTLWADSATLEFSFKTVNQETQTLLSQGTEWSVTLENGTLKWNHGDSSEEIASGLADGCWHSVAMVYVPGENAASYMFYVDGSSVPLEDDTPLPAKAGADIVAGPAFAGNMAGLRCTTSALSSEKLLSVTEQPFIAWWPFTSVDPVGTGKTSVPSADGNTLHELGAVLENVDEDAAYLPSVSDDVPCRSVWRPRSEAVLNPDNRTSLFFRNNGYMNDSGEWVNGDGGGYLESIAPLGNFGSSYTMEFFVKPVRTYSDRVTGLLTAILEDDRYMLVYAWHALKMSVQFSTSVTVGYGDDDLTPGEWHHVAVTVDSDSDPGNMTVSTYVDYNFASSFTTNQPFGLSSAYHLVLGSGKGSRCLDGFMDEVMVTPGVVSVDDFMREFDPGEARSKVWLVDGVSGNEHYDGGGSSWLTGSFADNGAAVSSDLPKSPLQYRVSGKGRLHPKQSVRFDGKGGLHIPCAAVAGVDDFTMEATVKGVGNVAGKRRSGGVSWCFGIGEDGIPFLELDTGNAIMAYETESSVSAKGECAVDITAWHHISLVCERMAEKRMTLYVDGVAVASVDAAGMVIDDGDLVVGGGFTGNIVGVGFTPSALDPDDFMMPEWRRGMTINIR